MQGEVDGGDSAHGEREQRVLQEQHLVRGQIRLSQRMIAKGDLSPRSTRHLGAMLPGRRGRVYPNKASPAVELRDSRWELRQELWRSPFRAVER